VADQRHAAGVGRSYERTGSAARHFEAPRFATKQRQNTSAIGLSLIAYDQPLRLNGRRRGPAAIRWG